MGKLILCILGALWVGGLLMMAAETYGAPLVAIACGVGAWLTFGKNKPKD